MKETKQLLTVNGIPLLQRIIESACASQLISVTVILGHDSDSIRAAINLDKVSVRENPDFAAGQSTSIQAGLRSLPADIDAALFILADQPLVDRDIFDRLVQAYQHTESLIVRPVFQEKPGNPVLMDRRVFPALMELRGDIGGRGIFSRFADTILDVPVPHGGIHIDLDIPEDYEALLDNTPSSMYACTLTEVLQPKRESVVSFVGAGGKTTAIFALARELKDQGRHVLVTTTTAMYHPDRDGWSYDRIMLGDDTVHALPPECDGGSLTVAAAGLDPDAGKILGLQPAAIDRIQSQHLFDPILVEADGSKRKPLKAPASHEPVIPDATTHLIGMIGLQALNRPLDETRVHRSRLFSALTGIGIGGAVTGEALQALITSPRGLFRGGAGIVEKTVILNGADTLELLKQGCRIGEMLFRSQAGGSIKRLLVCRLRQRRPVLAVCDRNTCQ